MNYVAPDTSIEALSLRMRVLLTLALSVSRNRQTLGVNRPSLTVAIWHEARPESLMRKPPLDREA
jgi:hypothetical protein